MEVKEAHGEAVAAGLAYLEEHACFSRTGKAGICQVDTEGFLAAAFDHRTSRAGDPQLHAHVVVSARVRCPDGKWRALDSRALHKELKTAGMLYQAALRAELTERLGVRWSAPDRHGQAEVLGVPEGLKEHWSTRRAEVEALGRFRIAEAEADLGRSLTAEERRSLFQDAVLDTRPDKERCGDGIDGGLFDRWHADATDAGFEPGTWLPLTVGRDTVEPDGAEWHIAEQALAELEASVSTWTRTEVVRQVVRRIPARAVGDADGARRLTELLANGVLVHPETLTLAAPAEVPPPDLARRDGASVFDHHGSPRFSTREALAAEQEVLDAVARVRDAGRSRARPLDVEVAVTNWGLDEDQVAAMRRLTQDGEAVAVLVGPAGTGKSRTVGAAADAWDLSKIPVRGLAVSASAAGVLAQEANVPSDTLARFLFDQGRDEPAEPLRRGEVVVLDEASMAATADLARLVRLAEGAEAKVVLVGDHRQLGAVGAGGLFGLLARDSAELGSVHRFAEGWEQGASLRLRERDPEVLAAYEEHGRIGGGNREAVLDEAMGEWRLARAAGESVVVCAPDHATVDALALRARAERVAAGKVEPEGIRAGRQTVGVGDEVVTTRNDRALLTTDGGWVRNGDRWRVLERHPDGGLLVEDTSGRGRALLPGDYVRDEVRLSYAVTLHKAQGLTVDHGVVVVDGRTTAEALYVGLTRGRLANVALAVTGDDLGEHDRNEQSPAEVVTRALARQGTERSGLEVLQTALQESRSLAVLGPRLANVEAWVRREEPPDRSRELGWARGNVEHFDRHGRPGWLTQEGRADRRRGENLNQQLAREEAHEAKRTAWRAEHAETLDYRDHLREATGERRRELGAIAAAEQPAHIVELLGPKPEDEHGACRWERQAYGIEAYREEWDVEPRRLREVPVDALQQDRWREQVRLPIEIEQQLDRQRQISHEPPELPELDHGLGIDL